MDCPNRPYQATITILNQKGKVVTRIQTDKKGYFEIQLPPGRYILRPESPGSLPYATEQTITVTARKIVPVEIIYDSGIR